MIEAVFTIKRFKYIVRNLINRSIKKGYEFWGKI